MTEPAPDYRRELYASALALVVGAGGLLWAANRAWYDTVLSRQPPFGPVDSRITGHHLHPALTGLAVVALLSGALVLIGGGLVRRGLGVLVLIVGGWTGWLALDSIVHHSRSGEFLLDGQRREQLTQVHFHTGWAGLSLACSLVLVLAGASLLARAGRWPGGLSRRYAAPAEAAAAPDPWRQLDRGEDPTITSG